jgi:hypothetical protein
MTGRQLQRNIRREVQATFTAAGEATAIIGPVPPGPAWEIKQITIKARLTATGGLPTVQTKATTFVGTNNSGQQISNTLTGNDDTDSVPNATIRYGESLCCFWTGGATTMFGRMTIIYDEVGY